MLCTDNRPMRHAHINLAVPVWMTCWKELPGVPDTGSCMWQPHVCRWLSAETRWPYAFCGWRHDYQTGLKRDLHHLGCFVRLYTSTREGLHFLIWGLIRKQLCVEKKWLFFFNFCFQGRKYLTHFLKPIQAKTLLHLSALELSSSTSVASQSLPGWKDSA